MLCTLVLLAGLLPPSQAEGLSLTDVRLTLGICGPPRPNARLLPGDNLIVSFDIAAITADEAGKLRFSTVTALSDDEGKATTVKRMSGTVNKDVPAKADVLPLQFPVALNRAGKFTLQLKATDKVSGKSVQFSAPFNVRSHR